MAFIQVIECRTSNVDEVLALEENWRQATEGKRTLRRSIVTRDRNDPARHLILASFDSDELAMVNSNLPETTEFGEKQAALLDGPMAFSDLDVIADRACTARPASAPAMQLLSRRCGHPVRVARRQTAVAFPYGFGSKRVGAADGRS